MNGIFGYHIGYRPHALSPAFAARFAWVVV